MSSRLPHEASPPDQLPELGGSNTSIQQAFCCDCMLGRLARWLRIIGFDTAYFHSIDDQELLCFAAQEGRLLLTRDNRLAAAGGEMRALLVRKEKLEPQLLQVVEHCRLPIQPHRILSRCIVCNGSLARVDRETIHGQVPDYVYSTQSSFSSCPKCGKIYWKSTHVTAMLKRLSEMGIALDSA